MIASGLIEMGFTVAGPDTGDDYDALVIDPGGGQGPQIAEWKSKKKQPSIEKILAAGQAREARMAAVKPDRERIAELEARLARLDALEAEVASLKSRA